MTFSSIAALLEAAGCESICRGLQLVEAHNANERVTLALAKAQEVRNVLEIHFGHALAIGVADGERVGTSLRVRELPSHFGPLVFLAVEIVSIGIESFVADVHDDLCIGELPTFADRLNVPAEDGRDVVSVREAPADFPSRSGK
jgi:hypothetical protein